MDYMSKWSKSLPRSDANWDSLTLAATIVLDMIDCSHTPGHCRKCEGDVRDVGAIVRAHRKAKMADTEPYRYDLSEMPEQTLLWTALVFIAEAAPAERHATVASIHLRNAEGYLKEYWKRVR